VKASRERIRCYIEGVEIPVIGVTVQISEDTPAAASVEVVPTDPVLSLLPRSFVIVTYLDDPVSGRADKQERIMFSGETVGVSFSSQVVSRSAVIRAVDESANWDTCYHFLYDIMGNSNATFLGGSTQVFDKYFRGHNSVTKSLIGDGVRNGPNTPGLRNLRGLLGGIIRLLEGVGGIRGQAVGTNDFFTYQERRLKLLQRIGTDSGQTANKLFSHTLFEKWVSNTIGSLGQLVTIRDLINNLNRFILYNVVPNPAPLYVGEPPNATGINRVYLPIGPTRNLLRMSRNVYQNLQKILMVVQDMHARGENISAAYKLYNYTVGSPSSVGQLATSGWYSLDLVYERITKAGQAAKGEQLPGEVVALRERFLAEVEVHHSSMQSQFDRPISDGDAARRVVTATVEDMQGRIKRIKDIYNEAAGLQDSKTYQYATSPRLITQIFRPDIWFAAPPNCNILFPNQYTTIQFSRNYMREVSRLQITSHDEMLGAGMFLNSHYFAPYIRDYIEGDDKRGGKRSIRHPMVHERLTGIIPKMERMSSANIFAERKYYQRNRRVRPQSGKRLGYADKIAHYLFYRNRYAPRTLQVTGVFNPKPVVGFPMVVMKEGWQLTEEAMRKMRYAGGLITPSGTGEELKSAPVQFIGVLRSISHTVSNPQESSYTSYGLTHVRHHDASDDPFLQDEIFGFTTTRTYTRKQVVKLQASDFLENYRSQIRIKRGGNNPALRWLLLMTPQDGLTKVDDNGKPEGVIGISVNDKNWNGEKILNFRVENNGDLFHKAEKPLGLAALRGLLSLPEGRKDFPFADFNIYESISFEILHVTGQKTLRVPFEEALRPGWFDEVYSNDKIGPDFYQKNLGCGSIVDKSENGSWGFSPGAVVSDAVLGEFTAIRSTDAINTLAYMYESYRHAGDIDTFVENITDRNIATLEDVLGRRFGLDLSEVPGSGRQVVTPKTAVTLDEATAQRLENMSEVEIRALVTKGAQEGFLSWSVMPLKNLVGLGDGNARLPRIHLRGRSRYYWNILKEIDVRLERRQAVEAYRQSINELLLERDD
jgi:hypothetical protein